MKFSKYIDILYKSLKIQYNKALKNLDSDKLNDKEFLYAALNFDVVSNALSIVLNYYFDNLDSRGVDINCRIIIEALSLLNMLSNGDISKEQIANFRTHSKVIERLDQKRHFEKYKKMPLFDNIEEEYQEAMRKLMAFYQASERHIKQRYVTDPLFVFKKTLNEKLKYSDIVNHYFPACMDMYKFFSILTHPNLEHNPNVKIALNRKRWDFITKMLQYVTSFLKNNRFYVPQNRTTSFDEDVATMSMFKDEIASYRKYFDNVIRNISNENKNGKDILDIEFLLFTKNLYTDMSIALNLGYLDQVAIKYRVFIEMVSIHFKINNSEDNFEYSSLTNGFLYQTRNSLYPYLTDYDLSGDYRKSIDEGLKYVYKTFYKDEYYLETYADFCENMEENPYYFITNMETGYRNQVVNFATALFKEEEIKELILDAYKVSMNIGHASGYNFNSEEGLIKIYSHVSLFVLWMYLYIYLVNVDKTNKEFDEEIDISEHIKTAMFAFDNENKAIKEICQEYAYEYASMIQRSKKYKV